MKFDEKVFQLRKESRLSQEEVAERMNVSRQTISNWENGSAQPTLSKAVDLADLFEVSLDELVGKTVRNIEKTSPILSALVGQIVTIYLNPETDAWISSEQNGIKALRRHRSHPSNLKVIMTEKKQRVERLFFLKDIIAFKKEGE